MMISENNFSQAGADFNIEIDAGISTKRELLNILAEKLGIPLHFGRNWDALFDALRDLSWIDSRVVRIVHKDLPPLKPRQELEIYLKVLDDSVKSWNKGDKHKLVVSFP